MIFKEEIMDKLENLFCKGCIIYGVYKTADFAIRFERAIVKEIKNRGEITFIHASTSKGVIVSSLNEKYWNKAFLFAKRVL